MYLGVLVIGGSYVVTRLALVNLEAGYAVSQLFGHVGDQLKVTYTLRNAGWLPKPWLEVHNPTTLPTGLAGSRPLDRFAGRAVVAGEGAAGAARLVPDRAAPHPIR